MSDMASSKLIVIIFYILAGFWIGIKGICDEDERIEETFKEDRGLIKSLPCYPNGRYRANSTSFWGIEARNGSVKLTVENLDLDDYAGDYLLIGSSVTKYGNVSDVFQGPPPLFLTGKATKPKKLIVSTSYQAQVYLVLVTKPMKREDTLGFSIRYQASGERIVHASTAKPVPTIAESWREAVSVCAEVPSDDSNDMVNSNITSFVVDSVMEQMKRDPKPITRSQIKVITLVQQRQRENEYFTMLTVERWDHPNVPLLEADKLREIFNSRRYEFPSGYKILLCDQIANDRAIKGEWLKTATLAFVPIFLFSLLLLWWFQHNRFWTSRVKKDDEKQTFQVEMFPSIMTNPAFVPDSPTEEIEFPQIFLNDNTKKNDAANKDSGFASYSTRPSSVKSTPGMMKRKVVFNTTPKEEQEDKIISEIDINLHEDTEVSEVTNL